MKIAIITLSILFSIITASATIHLVKVWDGYFQFIDPSNFGLPLTIQLGDTVQWIPLDPPSMVHTITSTNIPNGAQAFDQIWQVPADTFFQYIPAVSGFYEYECTPHAVQYGMVGTITVLGDSTSLGQVQLSNSEFIVYPNPAINILHFTHQLNPGNYRVYSIGGAIQLIGKSTDVVDVSTLTAGVYFIELLGDKPRTIKFNKR
jgi:hypothetical protein